MLRTTKIKLDNALIQLENLFNDSITEELNNLAINDTDGAHRRALIKKTVIISRNITSIRVQINSL